LGNDFDNRKKEPYLCFQDNIVIEVNKEFINFTGYASKELLGKSLMEIETMLKIDLGILPHSINRNYSGYIFTKDLDARFVTISFLNDVKTNNARYTFVEKSNSRLDDKLIFIEQAFKEDTTGVAVYSVPDFILLKANQTVVRLSCPDLLIVDINRKAFNIIKLLSSSVKSITELKDNRIEDLLKMLKWSEYYQCISKVLVEKKINYLNKKRFLLNGDEVYWNIIFEPILDINGEIREILILIIDVTVEISVRDNGIGIEEEYLDMIFDRFRQVDKSLSRNAEGTGIGLSLVKSIVKLHGGTITVESKFGKESKFTVKLPKVKVLYENMIYSSNVRSKSESIQVELSDVYS